MTDKELKEQELKIISLGLDKQIEILVKDYDRTNRKWLLDESAVKPRQEEIRRLRFKKQTALETFLSEFGSMDDRKFLAPLVLRRKYHHELDNKPIHSYNYNRDGEQFTFQSIQDTDSFQVKHSVGNWLCKGCLINHEKGFNFKPGEEQTRDIVWCPKFITGLAVAGPEKYTELVRKHNPDITICYGGLLHSEFTVDGNKATMTRKCDTCGFSTTETKELAKPFEGFEIGVDVGMGLEITCQCKECGEIVFTATIAEMEDMDIAKQYEKVFDQHWATKHLGVTR